MKKLLLAAFSIAALSTAAFAANENSLQYGNEPDLVLPIDGNATNKVLAKKKLFYGESTSTINSVGETGNVSEEDRILEKNGNNHDVAPF
jgi:opacity protein-like surface antigen